MEFKPHKGCSNVSIVVGEWILTGQNNKRDIYALCYQWHDSKQLVWKLYEAKKSKAKKNRVMVKYKYGPLTTMRLGEAMKKRKEVLKAKLFRNAFVKFPEILMGRQVEEDGYSEIEHYSSKCVTTLAAFCE